MRIALLPTILMFLLLGAQSAFAHHPCATIKCDGVRGCKDSAEWVVEGTVSDIIRTGSQKECETGPGGPRCSDVENPEIVVLSNAKVLKGIFKVGERGAAILSRKDSCFFGSLSFMNKKPELQSLGKKVRFFGSEERHPPFIQPGYFVVEPAE